MTTATYETVRGTHSQTPTVPLAPGPAIIRRRSVAPVLFMAAGLAVLVAAGALTVLPDRARHPAPTAARARPERPPAPATVAGPAAPAAGSQAITLSERDVSVVTQVYEPGHDSGWHTHPGIHAVAVLSGSMTVYDGECRATTYGPGQPYVGGRGLHLVRNQSSVPVEMSVTYLNPSSPGSSAQHFSAPGGCVGQQ